MEKVRLIRASIVSIAMAVGAVGSAHAFNPQPDPPGATPYETSVHEMNATLVNLSDELGTNVSCTVDVNVIAYASPGQNVVQSNVRLGPGEAAIVPLTEAVDAALGAMRIREALVRLKMDINKAENATPKKCEDALVGRVEVIKPAEFLCQLCAPVPVEMCKREECQEPPLLR